MQRLCERAVPISPMRKSSLMASETEEYSVYEPCMGRVPSDVCMQWEVLM